MSTDPESKAADPVMETKERARKSYRENFGYGPEYGRVEWATSFALAELRRLGASGVDVEGLAHTHHDMEYALEMKTAFETLFKSRRETEATDRLGLVYVDDEALSAIRKHIVQPAALSQKGWTNPDFVAGNRAAEEREIQAIREGYKAETCSKCDTVFLAHKHFIRCENEGCPMKDGKGSVLNQLMAEAGKREERRDG